MASTLPDQSDSQPRTSYSLSSVQPLRTTSPLGSTNSPDSTAEPSTSPLHGRDDEPQGPADTQLQQRLSRPPTAHGGPLSSHPSCDYSALSSAQLPASDAAMNQHARKISTDTYTTTATTKNRPRVDSLQSPTSPTSGHQNMENTSPRQNRPNTVRRLFSLSSLRQSFSSSRTSLSMRPDTSQDNYVQSQHRRTESPSVISTTASTTADQPSVQSPQRPSTAIRKKRSSTWFRRKSGFFGGGDEGNLDVLDEDGPEHKRFKQLPVLPEISSLSGGHLDGGQIGWDEQLFRS